MESYGFKEITTDWRMWPFSPWQKEQEKKIFGKCCQLAIEQTLISYSLALLTRYKSFDTARVETLCSEVMTELTKDKTKYWDKARYIYAQKPYQTPDPTPDPEEQHN